MTDLSILIPTLKRRKPLLKRLLNELHKQIREAGANAEIEIIVESDNGKLSTGKKRNMLINKAKGRYCVFLDDDDTISPNYLSTYLPMLRGNEYDVAELVGAYYEGGIFMGKVFYSIDNEWKNLPVKYMRPPHHLNIMRTRFYKRVRFPDSRKGEDKHVANRMIKLNLFQKEFKLPANIKPLYHHLCRYKKCKQSKNINFGTIYNPESGLISIVKLNE